MKKTFILIAAVAAMVCGCKKEPPEPVTPGPDVPQEEIPVKIPVNLSTEISTKATDSSYENGDKVGIYMVNYVNDSPAELAASGNHLDNMMFAYDGSSWKPEMEVYWKDQTTPADFYCYYPYSGTVSDVHGLAFNVKTDQSSTENYKASELLWGQTVKAKPSEDPVKITTRHMMSNVLIYVKPGKGYTEESLTAEKIDVTITGVKTSARIDLANGKVSAEGTAGDIVPYKENGHWRALVVPQDITGTEIVKITVGSDVYTLSQTVSFQSNKQHTCTITVDRLGEGVNIGIGGWETDDTDFGGTVE